MGNKKIVLNLKDYQSFRFWAFGGWICLILNYIGEVLQPGYTVADWFMLGISLAVLIMIGFTSHSVSRELNLQDEEMQQWLNEHRFDK